MEQQVVGLVASFLGGFAMTWLRGYGWFNDGITSAVALAGGAWCTYLLGAHTSLDWTVGIATHTLTIFGAVHIGGMGARARAVTTLPAAVLPKFNELSESK